MALASITCPIKNKCCRVCASECLRDWRSWIMRFMYQSAVRDGAALENTERRYPDSGVTIGYLNVYWIVASFEVMAGDASCWQVEDAALGVWLLNPRYVIFYYSQCRVPGEPQTIAINSSTLWFWMTEIEDIIKLQQSWAQDSNAHRLCDMVEPTLMFPYGNMCILRTQLHLNSGEVG